MKIMMRNAFDTPRNRVSSNEVLMLPNAVPCMSNFNASSYSETPC